MVEVFYIFDLLNITYLSEYIFLDRFDIFLRSAGTESEKVNFAYWVELLAAISIISFFYIY